MKLSILAGSTSQTVNVFVQDSSSSTGAALTGLAYNTGSLTAYYALPKAAAVVITLATQTVTGAYSSGGFVEIDATNMPGWYRLDLPNATIASGRFVAIHLKGATNMAPLPIEIELTATDNQSTTAAGTNMLDLASGVEASITLRQAMRVLLAAAGGKVDGAASTTVHLRDQADTLNRITATVDSSGNRTAVTLNLG